MERRRNNAAKMKQFLSSRRSASGDDLAGAGALAEANGHGGSLSSEGGIARAVAISPSASSEDISSKSLFPKGLSSLLGVGSVKGTLRKKKKEGQQLMATVREQ